MINADAEISRLRTYLLDRGWYDTEIEDICDLASRDINEVILEVVSNAVAEATEHAEELGAEEFIEEMDVVEVGNSFMITTLSGKTDFSIPERKMLPDLVKNGEISEDGNRYKVIPVGKKKEISRPMNIFSDLQQKQQAQQEARRSLLESNMDMRSARAQHMAGHFKQVISRRLNDIHSRRISKVEEKSDDIQFRTASEKQDPNTQWVIPAVKMDMTGYLMDMNRRIDDTIRDSVIYIIDSYKEEFS